MSKSLKTSRNPAATKQRLVGATLGLMLRQGFNATTVDQICAEAKLTKGSFFHYFDTKEEIGRAAVDFFAQVGTDLYSEAWKDAEVPALEQLHRLFDIMIGFAKQPEPLVCMVGMMSQEMSLTHPEFRKACAGHLDVWSDMVIRMLNGAKKAHRPKVNFDSAEVAWFLNSLWQGSMLIGKVKQDPRLVIRNLKRARAYVDSLFGDIKVPPKKRK
ncbi:MAG: TetR/AcrR family transcriptional regulator [Chthoniobacterales bacterium]